MKLIRFPSERTRAPADSADPALERFVDALQRHASRKGKDLSKNEVRDAVSEAFAKMLPHCISKPEVTARGWVYPAKWPKPGQAD